MLPPYYSENHEKEMEEFDKWLEEGRKAFEALTPEEASFDHWDPRDDYIPELDDIKPVVDIVNRDNDFPAEDYDLEWKDEYSIDLGEED